MLLTWNPGKEKNPFPCPLVTDKAVGQGDTRSQKAAATFCSLVDDQNRSRTEGQRRARHLLYRGTRHSTLGFRSSHQVAEVWRRIPRWLTHWGRPRCWQKTEGKRRRKGWQRGCDSWIAWPHPVDMNLREWRTGRSGELHEVHGVAKSQTGLSGRTSPPAGNTWFDPLSTKRVVIVNGYLYTRCALESFRKLGEISRPEVNVLCPSSRLHFRGLVVWSPSLELPFQFAPACSG